MKGQRSAERDRGVHVMTIGTHGAVDLRAIGQIFACLLDRQCIDVTPHRDRRFGLETVRA